MNKLLFCTKKVLVIFDQGLHEVGRLIGELTIAGLAIALCLCPIVALLLVSLYAALGVATLLGGGDFLGVLLFWCFVGLIGWYVSPHVQPKVLEAFLALAKVDPSQRNRS
jgi:hypothetical protein